MLKKFTSSGIGLLLLIAPLLASAQTSVSVQVQIDALLNQISQLQAQITALRAQSSNSIGDSSRCVYLEHPLVVGSTDAATNGEVSKLQQFLVAAGVYPEARITGYYGLLTAQAVVRWQKAHGMDFVTTASGVGPMTRAKLREQCGKSILLPVTCTDQQGTAPVITSISPLSGPIGTKIAIRGCNFWGFEGDLDAVLVRSDGAKIQVSGGNVYNGDYDAADRGKIMFVIVQPYCVSGSETGRYSGIVSPCTTVQATPGVYKVYVTAYEKKSNEAQFTITEK